jgi:hypothetical protein
MTAEFDSSGVVVCRVSAGCNLQYPLMKGVNVDGLASLSTSELHSPNSEDADLRGEIAHIFGYQSV